MLTHLTNYMWQCVKGEKIVNAERKYCFKRSVWNIGPSTSHIYPQTASATVHSRTWDPLKIIVIRYYNIRHCSTVQSQRYQSIPCRALWPFSLSLLILVMTYLSPWRPPTNLFLLFQQYLGIISLHWYIGTICQLFPYNERWRWRYLLSWMWSFKG